MTPADIAAALLRTTLATSAAALTAWALLAWLRIDAPRIHRIAWLLVIAQGWLFFPLTIEIETESPPTATKRAAGLVPAGITEQATTPFLTEAPRGREPFATSNSPLMDAFQSQKAPDTFSLAPIAIASWLLGAITLAAIAVYRYWQVLRTLPLGSPPEEHAWQAEWHATLTAAQLRRRQPVDLRITTSLGPLLHWAPWVYLILVPRPLWTTLAAPQRQAILRHELAHLCRGDLWKSLAIRVLALPQWFNPLAWLAIRRFDEAAEWACDDAAAATADGRLTFAESLLQSAEYAAAPFPASAPAARGTLTRRIHRLVNPRFKEESKMKLLVPPLLLLLLAMFQTLRIERVVADETLQEALSFQGWSLAEEFSIPLAERLENTKRRHAQLIAERQRHLDAADSRLSETQDVRHLRPPLSQEQLDLDYNELAKEFENFKRVTYVIEPPDVLSIRIDYSLSSFNRLDGPISDVELPRLKVAECMDKAPRRYVVGMDGCVRLDKVTSIYVAGMTLREAEDAIQTKLAPQGLEVAVRLSIAQFNSKGYYVITQRGEYGDEVTRLPIPYPVNGRENIAEALARVYDNADRTLKLKDLADASLTLVRPAPNGVGLERTYPIVWDASTQAPTPLTNHGILPGDRVFVKLNHEGQPAKNVSRKLLPAVPPPPVAPSSEYKEAASEVLSNEAAELSIKRVGDSLLLVRERADERASGESSGDVGKKLKISPRWLEGRHRLQPYDTLKLRIARPHRPAYALTWEDVVTECTLSRDGSITMNREQGAAQIGGMTVEEARTAIERQLRKTIPDCKVHLELGTLASQKFFVSIQRHDGTEIAAGALPADASASASFHLGGLRMWLGDVGEASWEHAEPSATHANPAYLPKRGDRLVIKVPVDFDPLASRPLPRSVNDEADDSIRTMKSIARPFWIEVIGNIQVEPPQSKLPSAGSNDLGFVIEPRFLPNVRRHAAAP